MNNDDAKKILALFRPGTTDRTDPFFKEALELAQSPPPKERGQARPETELTEWFHEHCASHLGVQARLLKISPPSGLKERILAEGQPQPAKIIPFRFMPALAAAAAILVCLGLVALWTGSRGDNDFAIYRSRMVRTALQGYSMDLRSTDLPAINAYLASRKAPANYIMPHGLENAHAVGCAVLHWQGGPVSMVCFKSGQPLARGAESDLWLFVVDKPTFSGGPSSPSPNMATVKKISTATWSEGDKTYILATSESESVLRKFL
jgi:hypothetical protein